MGRKAKEMCIKVKEIMWKLLQDGKTIFHVSETLGIPKLTITCFHNVQNYEFPWKTSPDETKNPTVSTPDVQKLERLISENNEGI